MRLRCAPSNESVCGKPQPWFTWHPVWIGDELVWLEWVTRTRWHSPMGYWYWAYSEEEPI